MNLRITLGILLGVAALGTLFIARANHSTVDATRPTIAAAVTTTKPTNAEPAFPESPPHALAVKLGALEEKTKELQARRDQAAALEKERELQLRVADARESAKGYTGRWMSDFNLTDTQRGPIRMLFERWLAEDAERGDYASLNRRAFEKREAELRLLLTPEQHQARHDAVRGQIEDVWKNLSISVSLLSQGLDPGFMMMGPPWTPASRANAESLLKDADAVMRLAGIEPVRTASLPDTSLLGECPEVPTSVLLADAHDLGLLGLWRRAEPRVRSLLTEDQMKEYLKLVPRRENPDYHHGY